MPPSDSQTFLRELDKKLWTAADKLRSNLDAAVYKHAVLGLIFLKYVSDSFAQRQEEIAAMIKDPENDFFMDPASYDSPAKYEAAIHAELEERDYDIKNNVFWVTSLARWRTLQDAKLPPDTEIQTDRGSSARSYKFISTGKLIDDALEPIEKENPTLKGVLESVASVYDSRTHPFRSTRLPHRARRVKTSDGRRLRAGLVMVRPSIFASLRLTLHAQSYPANLIDLIAGIPFQHADLHAKDILGHHFSPNGATQASLGHRPRFPSPMSRAPKGRHISATPSSRNSSPESSAFPKPKNSQRRLCHEHRRISLHPSDREYPVHSGARDPFP